MKSNSKLLMTVTSLLFLNSCGSSEQKAETNSTERFGRPNQVGLQEQNVQTQPAGVQAVPTPARPQMLPLQPGQPPQRPEKSVSTVAAVAGGSPGTNPLPFNQPFQLADNEYQFMAARGKDYVGLDANPAMRPAQGNSFFLVRYQVINHGTAIETIPNGAAVHLFHKSTNQVTDIDVAATNANVQSGAATGMPDSLSLDPGQPQIQTLAFQIPATIDPRELCVLVNEPRDPSHVFQLVRLTD